jgi:hypothetical protein
MRLMPTLRPALLAALALLAGAAQAQFSSPMRNVENPDRFPYMERGSTTINVNVVNNFIRFPTPAGKRYIIEYVSVNCTSPSATDSFPQVFVQVARLTGPNSVSTLQTNAVPMERRGPAPFGGFIYAGSANVKLYADALPFDPTGGDGIVLNIFRSDFSVSPTCSALVSGHTLAL